MKRIFLSILSANLVLTSLYATSLKDVVIKTIDNNSDILSEKFNKEAYKKYIDEEKGDYLPTLDFNGYIEDSTTRLNRDDQINDPSKAKKDGWNASLSLEQILYDGGKTPSEVEEFRHKYYSNKFRSDRRVEEIIRTSIDSYIDLVKYQELMDISENNIKVHGNYLEIAQEKEKISGEILESFQVNSKKHFVIDRYLEQKILKNEANNKFEELTSQKIEGNICRPILDEKYIPNSLEKIIEEALRKNTKILETIEKIKEQREIVVQTNAKNLPELLFQWQMSWDNDLSEAENGREDINRVRLVLNWNLFEGGKTRNAKIKEKLFLLEQQKVLDTITNEVIREVKTSYLNYFDTKAKVENIKKFVQDNKNIKDIYFKQLADGTRTFIDILNAESELFRSQVTAIEEEYRLYALYYDLLAHRNMLSDAILMSDNQICKKFIGVKYEDFTKQKDKEKETVDDADLLNELGMTDEGEVGISDENSTIVKEEINEQLEINISKNVSNENLISDDLEIAKMLTSKMPIKNVNEESKLTQEIQTLEEKTSTEKQLIEEKIDTTSILPKGKYTINIANLNKDEDIDSFINQMNLNKKNVHTYNLNKNTKVLYGNYETLKEASNIIKQFSQKLIESGIYVDNLEKHRNIISNYKSIN
ncbi:TolC family outer membrane protein [Poseidonibacter sp.]|uniref:TolC family outer membrane protein n=2 Tax=Poseidonibacter sp. TaxID=2321188 RepID=UPI003C71359D